MGVQPVGEKKLRKVRQETGLDFDRVVVLTNTSWEGRLPHDDGTHSHFSIDPRTWDVAPDPSAPCWSTCRLGSSPRRAESA